MLALSLTLLLTRYCPPQAPLISFQNTTVSAPLLTKEIGYTLTISLKNERYLYKHKVKWTAVRTNLNS